MEGARDGRRSLHGVTFYANSVPSGNNPGAWFNESYNTDAAVHASSLTIAGNGDGAGGAVFINDGFVRMRGVLFDDQFSDIDVNPWVDEYGPPRSNVKLDIAYSLTNDSCPNGASCQNLNAADPALLGFSNGLLVPGGSSPAIDGASCADMWPVDARGMGRYDGSSSRYPNTGGFCDVGAVEMQQTELIGDSGRLYVREGGTGSGGSWRTASGSLHQVLEAAQSGDSIFVAAGTYTPEPASGRIATSAVFTVPDGVTIQGGFRADCDNTAPDCDSASDARPWTHRTILSGDIDGNDLPFTPTTDSDGNPSTPSQTDHIRGSNSSSVVYAGLNQQDDVARAALRGVTVTGGRIDAINVVNADVALTDVEVSGNGTSGISRAIRVTGGYYSDGRWVDGLGGALSMTRVRIDGNAVSTTSGAHRGSALYVDQNTQKIGTWTDVVISRNVGARSVVYLKGLSVTADRVTAHHNAASMVVELYGENDAHTFTNLTVAHNSAQEGIRVIEGTATFTGVTFAKNSGQALSISNSVTSPVWVRGGVFANDSDEFGPFGQAEARVANTVVRSQYSAGLLGIAVNPNGNVVADPLMGALGDNGGFVPTMLLGAGSPALDTGSCEGLPTLDARGEQRNRALQTAPGTNGCDAGAVESKPDEVQPFAWTVSLRGGTGIGDAAALTGVTVDLVDAQGSVVQTVPAVAGQAVFAGLSGGPYTVRPSHDALSFAPKEIRLPGRGRTTMVRFYAVLNPVEAESDVAIVQAATPAAPLQADLSGVGGLSGGRLDIPAGALTEDIDIQIGTFTKLPDDAPAYTGPVLFFGPTGQTFAQPITIRIPKPSGPLPEGAEAWAITRFDDVSGTYQQLMTTEENGFLIAQTSQFSGYGAAPTSNQALPVELTTFDALLEGADVLLAWQTASETNNSGFEVQMWRTASLDDRTDGTADYVKVGWVEGMGTTTEAQRYAFRAPDLAPGRYAFRLRQIDLDGAFEYSSEVELTVAADRTLRLDQAWPNPMQTRAQVGFTLPRDGHALAELFDVTGRRVAVLTDQQLEAGRVHTLQLDGSQMASGIYLIRLTFEGEVKTQRVVVAR